jgi:hypothetical protein
VKEIAENLLFFRKKKEKIAENCGKLKHPSQDALRFPGL